MVDARRKAERLAAAARRRLGRVRPVEAESGDRHIAEAMMVVGRPGSDPARADGDDERHRRVRTRGLEPPRPASAGERQLRWVGKRGVRRAGYFGAQHKHVANNPSSPVGVDCDRIAITNDPSRAVDPPAAPPSGVDVRADARFSVAASA